MDSGDRILAAGWYRLVTLGNGVCAAHVTGVDASVGFVAPSKEH